MSHPDPLHDELEVEPIESTTEEQDESPIEIENWLIQLRDKRFPLQQKINLLNHQIEQAKSKLKVATMKYWQNKDK